MGGGAGDPCRDMVVTGERMAKEYGVTNTLICGVILDVTAV